jgi:hypothetical protein
MPMKDITRFNRTQMKILATYVKGRIIEDMNNGIFQNDKRDLAYRSSGDVHGNGPVNIGDKKYYYTIYKANGMNKLNGTGRLKGIAGSTDRQINKVNMILTGRTKDGMREGGKKNIAYITYDQGHIVQGNANRKPNGYKIIGLRPKNLSLTAKYMATHLLSKNARRELAKIKDWK